MKTSIILISFFLLLSVNVLCAKTIWIKDLTNNHSSMVTFYNVLKEDLNLTNYKQFIRYVTDNKDISAKEGDIVISLCGQGTSSNTGNVTYFYYIGCTVDEKKNWIYHANFGSMFSDDHIHEWARDTRNSIIKFLNDYF